MSMMIVKKKKKKASQMRSVQLWKSYNILHNKIEIIIY